MTGKTTGQAENDSAFVAGWSAAAAARLKKAIKRFGSQGQVASRAGISRQSLVEILRFDEGAEIGSRPRYKTLMALCDAINIDESDILGSPGRMSIAEADPSLPMAGDVRLNGDDYNVVLQREVDVSAGVGILPLSEAASGGIAFQRSWLIQRGIAPDMAALVTVKGDSMAPTIPDGATVLLQLTPNIDRKAIYVFRRGDEVSVKRLHPMGLGEGRRPTSVAVISDNPAYSPEILEGEALDDLKAVGMVRTVLADL